MQIFGCSNKGLQCLTVEMTKDDEKRWTVALATVELLIDNFATMQKTFRVSSLKVIWLLFQDQKLQQCAE